MLNNSGITRLTSSEIYFENLRFFCNSMIPYLHQLVLIEVPQLWILLRAVGVHRGVLVAATFGTV